MVTFTEVCSLRSSSLASLAVDRDLGVLGHRVGSLLLVRPDHRQLAVGDLDHVPLVDGVLLLVRAGGHTLTEDDQGRGEQAGKYDPHLGMKRGVLF